MSHASRRASLRTAGIALSLCAGLALGAGTALADYADGTYEATGKGIGGDVPLTVVIEGGSIASVEVGENGETTGIGSKAIEILPQAIVEANGIDGVDGVAGASVTSSAILTAMEEILDQAQAGNPSDATAEAQDPSNNEAPAATDAAAAAAFDIAILDTMALDDLVYLRGQIDERIAALESAGAVATPVDDPSPEAGGQQGYVGQSAEFENCTVTVVGEWQTATKSYGDETYIRVPLTVANNDSSANGINLFYVTYYGSRGTKLDIPYFSFDDEMAGLGDMRPGAVGECAAYLEYDGDGTYYITLSSWTEEVELAIPVELGQ